MYDIFCVHLPKLLVFFKLASSKNTYEKYTEWVRGYDFVVIQRLIYFWSWRQYITDPMLFVWVR